MNDEQHKQLVDLIESHSTKSSAQYKALEDSHTQLIKRMDKIEIGLYGDDELQHKGIIYQATEAYKEAKKIKGFRKGVMAFLTVIITWLIKETLGIEL